MAALGKAAAFFVLGKACDFILQKKGNVVLEAVRVRALSMSGRAVKWFMKKRVEATKVTPTKNAPLQDPMNTRVRTEWWWHADVDGKCVRPARIRTPEEQPLFWGRFRRPRWLHTVSFSALDGAALDPTHVFERPEDAARFLASRL
ncbi:MAG: hypothetical protein A3I44_06090 [Candidatus Sungbacteria bacterium RIFCSPLOWO2_02_FULL_51_17]|uniref:Uncharacterized protein n=1 Tax=Candidatus Sungbacteria bacterium RIFCSPHIGHO2_02_FULL_51_29 TaxID=1802273 RepID=A0A1G2KZA3_9BACT|nr:MAG: hypothetical protein A2676_04405 [Candidatus Sungbacteria bacterium RIFCSPHIGHO2_01_FULL_51_22]OHA03842.1 MAG: hypothetical protein A3C16_05150 [Candidatus Sungbacteria bacterium RIFCSPHIGHO2_02_FULL_51_29]OHA05941.1 MAG: hypothetical protein A3B29_02480 [Candidatus Sungbacteria bacterium RIFCSPLOWO2_01_FULL_51_34]OHA10347.1 MAG: hypothetical protein A3I44_06090 [Candidatus Sungbacteria bacterium RIFCSPLOWO2_02_FULL_51_17]